MYLPELNELFSLVNDILLVHISHHLFRVQRREPKLVRIAWVSYESA